MPSSAAPALVWFRRDLRLSDHPALHGAAKASGGAVVPAYVLSDWKGFHRWTGEPRQRFLCGALASLAQNLAALGARLVLRTGDAVEELERLIEESRAASLWFHLDPDPFGVATERKLIAMAGRRGVAVHALPGGVGVHERDALLSGTGRPYQVYAPYARAWRKLPMAEPLRAPRGPLTTPAELRSEPLPDVSHWALKPDEGTAVIEPGERAARGRLTAFLRGPAADYAAQRDQPAATAANASRLSQDLRFGLVSAREAWNRSIRAQDAAESEGARTSIDKFLGEMIWRDFFFQVLWHHPEVLEVELNPLFRGLPWRADDSALRRWQDGLTGFPFVDAGMRQLRATGYMHNRVRIVTAMFLTKDLRLDWRMGEQWFMQRLADGDIANNNGNWQWCAGSGADAAPYFRIQNPWTQSARHDPAGDYIRAWLPELRDVPAEALHEPPAPGRALAPGYPAPMVSHAREREETLRVFRTHLAGARQKSDANKIALNG